MFQLKPLLPTVFALSVCCLLPACGAENRLGDLWPGWELKHMEGDPDAAFPPADQINVIFAITVAEVEKAHGPQFEAIANEAADLTISSAPFWCGGAKAVGCTDRDQVTIMWAPETCFLTSAFAHEIIHLAQRVVDGTIDGAHASPEWWAPGGIETRVYERLKLLEPAFCS